MSRLPGNSLCLLKNTPTCPSHKYILNLYETGEERRGEERRGEERRLQTEQRTNSLVTQHASVETQLPSFQTLLKSPVCFSPWKKVSVVQMWILGHTTKSTYFTKSKQTVQLIIWYFEWKVCVATDDTGSSTQTSE